MPSRASYLRAMGIEVWTRRALVPAVPKGPDAPAGLASGAKQDTAPAVVETAAAAVPSIRASLPTPVETRPPEVPRFRLGMLHYGDFSVCMLLAEKAEFPRRFSDDVARLMGADIAAARYQQLDWPMLDTQGIDQSVHAAREVVMRKFSVLGRQVLVIGTDIGDYYLPLAGFEPLVPRTVDRQSMLWVPGLRTVTASADSKQQFMYLLLGWREA